MVDVFEALRREELEALARSCRLVEYATGETIFEPEAGAERVYVLEEGRVRLYRVGARGQEITLAVLSGGTVFGRLGPADRTQGAYA